MSALLLSFAMIAAICQAADKGPTEMILESTVDPANKKKLAFFPHAKHQGKFDCATCHHSKDADGKQVPFQEEQKIEKCASCHNTKAGINEKLDTFKKAAHARCRTCHKELKKAGREYGPTKCTGCHLKKIQKK